MSNVDLSALLYLNPELAAYSNVATVSAAQAAWAAGPGTLASLSAAIPPAPAGFDARLYAAATGDVSGTNETIRLAMIATGLSAAAVERRGVYVANIAEEVMLNTTGTSGDDGRLTFSRTVSSDFSPCNVRVGDAVQLQAAGLSAPLGFLQGSVVGVGAPSGTVGTLTIAPFPSLTSRTALASALTSGRSNYTLHGIRMYDVERQANVGLSRTPGLLSAGYDDDAVQRQTFDVRAYQSAHPDARSLGASDAYLDYRGHWRRGAYRVGQIDDVVNANAPRVTLVGSTFVMTSNATTLSNTMKITQRLGIGMDCDGTEGDNAATSGTRLAVQGDIFSTGTVLTLSDTRAKADIEPIRDALERVGRLRGCTYLIRDASGGQGHQRRHTGLLAQDVATAMPEAMYRAPADALPGRDAPGSIAYGNLAGLFVEAIKQLADKVEALEGRGGGGGIRANGASV